MKIGMVAGVSGHIAPFAQRLSSRGSDLAVLPVRPGDEAVLPTGREHRLCTSMDELLEHSDAVLIVEDRRAGADHFELARPALQAGIPTFVDKPLAPSLATSEELFALADANSASLMSCSAARYAAPIEMLRQTQHRVGLTSLTLTGPGDLWFYGVHLVEIAVAVLGPGFAMVRSIADGNGWSARLQHSSGAVVALTIDAGEAAEGFTVVARSPETFGAWPLTDFGQWYDLLVEDMLTMAHTGSSPIDAAELREIMRVLDAIQRSAGRTIPATLMDA